MAKLEEGANEKKKKQEGPKQSVEAGGNLIIYVANAWNRDETPFIRRDYAHR